jgi:hypothetical protein
MSSLSSTSPLSSRVIRRVASVELHLVDSNTIENESEQEDNSHLTHFSSSYSLVSYWENRYSRCLDQLFDWYVSYEDLKHLGIWERLAIKHEEFIVHSGVGNSEFPLSLHSAGYNKQLALDISSILISHLQHKYQTLEPNLIFRCVDCTSLVDQGIQAESIDWIIDKGTLDALTCTDKDRVKLLIDQYWLSLRPNGKLLLITHGNEELRLPLLRSTQRPWEVKVFRSSYSLSALLIRRLREISASEGIPIKRLSASHLQAAYREARLKKIIANKISAKTIEKQFREEENQVSGETEKEQEEDEENQEARTDRLVRQLVDSSFVHIFLARKLVPG